MADYEVSNHVVGSSGPYFSNWLCVKSGDGSSSSQWCDFVYRGHLDAFSSWVDSSSDEYLDFILDDIPKYLLDLDE